jgi:hypothetical protein
MYRVNRKKRGSYKGCQGRLNRKKVGVAGIERINQQAGEPEDDHNTGPIQEQVGEMKARGIVSPQEEIDGIANVPDRKIFKSVG